ncbi:hypothetical protein [Streptomyces sp. IBSBF 2390]|uniref:hypothetical protein n=1 Tax=Streptomyces sp. IBSBF 2390 TaxID=2903533 RepID=UPI002FDC46DD
MNPVTDGKTRHLRRVTSLKLAEMSAGGTWPACAKALGIPWTTAQQSLNVLKRVLGSARAWAEFDRAVERIACALDSDSNRIDYANRRRELSSWHLSDASWAELCDGLKAFRSRPTSPNPSAATALLWALVTQGDYLHSPVLQQLRDVERDTTSVVASVNQILRAAKCGKGEKALLAKRLNEYAGHLALACDQTDGADSPWSTPSLSTRV